MSCAEHKGHAHIYGPDCGHAPVRHAEHVDFLHDGHLPPGDPVDEHSLVVNTANPAACTPTWPAALTTPRIRMDRAAATWPSPTGTTRTTPGRDLCPPGAHCDDHGSVVGA